MKVRLQERIFARDLRKQGFSFSEIIERIPNLSKGTLNSWLKDIELTQTQRERLLEKIKNGADKGRLKGAFSNHQKKIEITQSILTKAKEEAKIRSEDSFFVSGLMLYWAEGDKTQERIGFTNADPNMISFIMKWFREVCEIPEVKFRVYLNITVLHDKEAVEKFWSEITKINLTQFGKTRVKETILKGKRNSLYNGTCRIVVSDKNLFRKVLGWRTGYLEKFNILPS